MKRQIKMIATVESFYGWYMSQRADIFPLLDEGKAIDWCIENGLQSACNEFCKSLNKGKAATLYAVT